MSWFDTVGIANFAKTALKEAQKQIDKALDIKDDDPSIGGEPNRKISKTEPSSPEDAMKSSNSSPAALSSLQQSVWGSFNGSFFENSLLNKNETVTTPPTSLRKQDEFSTPPLAALSSDSESLEILSNPTTPGSSLTSPSAANVSASVSTILGSESVEVLCMETPTSENFSATSSVVTSNINSPSSVEVISEESFDQHNRNFDDYNNEDDEDDSISYNTVSDTVVAVTVIEPTNSTEMESKGIITIPPCRSSLHLSLGGSFNLSNVSDESNDSDQTIGSSEIKTKNSSTNLSASGLEDVTLEKSSIESFDVTTQLSDSTQSFEDVNSGNLLTISYNQGKPLLTENCTETSPPLSSDSKSSDLVKICSNQNSGHTSGDEIETATSSDIEIISSPNGDSSSTNSICRISPKMSSSTLLAKSRGFEILGSTGIDITNRKGHSRDLSEISIKSDDSSQNEHEKICELQNLLEVRQMKILELERHNADLQKKYTEIVEKMQSTLEINNITEEYTQRLSALEKKFQQTIRERDQLRKQLENTKLELSTRIEKEQFDKIIKENDYVISELRLEGEKLSKQVLQHSNIIKKLRAKEKENEAINKKQKEQIEEFSDEVERLKKSLSAKDEVERSQIEAVHKLSSEKRKLEKENFQYASQLEDVTQKLNTIQKSFDVAKKELTEKQNAQSELTKKSDEIINLESENKLLQSQKELMLNEIEELREKLKQSKTVNSSKEQNLRMEKSDLLRRLEEAEMRAEEQAQAVSTATIPLMKQLESLQSTLMTRTNAWEKREQELIDKLEKTQKKLSNQTDVEQSSKEQVTHLLSTVANLEERLASVLLKSEQTISALGQKELEIELLQHNHKKEIEALKTNKRNDDENLAKYKERICQLEEQLQIEKDKVKIEKQKISNEIESIPSKSSIKETDDIDTLQGDDKRDSISSSPTQSLTRISYAESQTSNMWPLDDYDYLPINRQIGSDSIYGSNILAPIGHAPFLESLQSALKQKDGELHQLQWELSRLQTERSFLTSEISNLTSELDTVKESFEKIKNIEEQFIDLQQKYDAILQMYGEKVEETQELKLDLQDVKEMYKAQIDELLKQQKLTNIKMGDIEQN